jgi:hypothetical protein
MIVVSLCIINQYDERNSNGLPFISGAIDIPHYLARAAGMHVYASTNNTLGVALLSRQPLTDVRFGEDVGDARRSIGMLLLLLFGMIVTTIVLCRQCNSNYIRD